MPDPADDAPSSPPAPPPTSVSASHAGRQVRGLVYALAVGVAARLLWAWVLRDHVAEWESDGFVWAWEGRPFDTLNRMRPAGGPWLLGRLGDLLRVDSILQVRWMAVGLSIVAFLAAVDLAASLARLTGLTRRSGLLAASWMAWVWALDPTLVASSVAPVPETLVGAAACVFLAGLARRVPGPGLFGLLLAALGGAALVSTGGTPCALALLVGLLVFLIPVPRLLPALGAASLVAVALGVGWYVQRGPDAQRPFLPESGAVDSLLALTSAADRPFSGLAASTDLRDRQDLDTLRERWAEEWPDVSLGVLERLATEQLGPARFTPLAEALLPHQADGRADPRSAGLVLPLGVFDLFLRGGMLLFALTVLGLTRREGGSGWPRAACGVGLLVWLVALTAGAIGPFAAAPFDLVLLGLAGAGVAGGDPSRPRTRRVAFVLGGVLLCTLFFTGGWGVRPLRTFTTDLTHVHGDGQLLVDVLKDGGPRDAPGHGRAATLLMEADAPLLRIPRAALRHATTSLELAPDAPGANEAYVRALVECGRYAEAARLAEELHTEAGSGDVRSKAFLSWVQDEQRRARDVPVR